MLSLLSYPHFWMDLGQIMLVNIILSGDNAVVIALAARSLPQEERGRAILTGSVAAILMRVSLTFVALEMLKLPYLRLVGSLLLIWIAIKLLIPADSDHQPLENQGTLIAAVRTILIADLIMSLDNVLAVAAAANGHQGMLIVGLAISIPIVIFGSTLILKLMERYPTIITFGAAVLGYVAGEMFVTEPVLAAWPGLEPDEPAHQLIPIGLALAVILIGNWQSKKQAQKTQLKDLAKRSKALEETSDKHPKKTQRKKA